MDILNRMKINFLFKVLYFPLILFSFPKLFPVGVVYSSWMVPLLLSLFFIGIGLVADEIVLPRFGLVSSTLQGAAFMIVVIWFVQFLFVGTAISVPGAILMGLSIGIGEFFMHTRILAWQRAS